MLLSSLVKQAVLRSAVLVIGKGIGLAGRVAITRMLGAEGIGLYQIAYSFFGMALMVISGGLPTTLALFTAKQPNRGWRVFQLLSVYTAFIGMGLAFWTQYYANNIAVLIGDVELAWALRALAPALIAVPLLQLARGYMQGIRSYEAISLSELTEQAVRITVLITFVSLYAAQGVGRAIGYGLYGTTIAAIAAFLFLTIYASSTRRTAILITYSPLSRKGLGLFLRSSFVIGCTRMLVPLSDFIDSILIPNRLQAAGYSISDSIAMYGTITGMAAVIVYMPTMITASVSYTVTMKIAAKHEAGMESGRDIERILRFVWIWGIISGLFIFLYAKEAAILLFGVEAAAEPIRYLSAIPLIVGLRELTTSILWAQERKRTPLTGLALGIGLSVLLQYVIVAIPGFGYRGAVIGILLMETVAVLWNLHALRNANVTLFTIKWVGWGLILFSCIMFVLISAFIKEGQLTLIVLSALFYWICAAFLIIIRYRK